MNGNKEQKGGSKENECRDMEMTERRRESRCTEKGFAA
jgi:hypothetical protein